MGKICCEAGVRIRQLREEKGYTREYLSRMADISPKFLYEIEKGSKKFSAETLYRLTEALNTNADYLLFGEYKGPCEEEVFHILSRYSPEQRQKLLRLLQVVYEICEV